MPRVKKAKQEEKVEVKEEVCGCPPEELPIPLGERSSKAPKKEREGSSRPQKPKVKKQKKDKKPRKPSEYATFVKTHYQDAEVQALPSKERFKKISVLWKKHKETKKTSSQ